MTIGKLKELLGTFTKYADNYEVSVIVRDYDPFKDEYYDRLLFLDETLKIDLRDNRVELTEVGNNE